MLDKVIMTEESSVMGNNSSLVERLLTKFSEKTVLDKVIMTEESRVMGNNSVLVESLLTKFSKKT